MRKPVLAMALCAALLFSCRENKNTIPGANVPANEQSGNEEVSGDRTAMHDEKVDTVMAFIVSFYSTGSGIDRGEPEKLKSYIEQFGKKINREIGYSEMHWGREGETDYCFPLKELSGAQVIEFKKGARETLGSAGHVHFFEDQACRKGRS